MKKIIILILFLSVNQVYTQWIQTLNGISIWSLAKDLNGNIYAGSLGSTSALYKTTNTGMNWVSLTSGNSQTVFSIAVDSMGNIFAANFSNGLLKSTNGGLNFVTIPAGSFGGSSLNTVACGKRGEVYVGTNGAGFYRSIDTGNTFTAATGLNSQQVISIFVNKYNSSIVYAGTTSTSPGPNGFYRSTDYGASFSVNLNPNKNIYGIIQKTPTDLYSISTTTGGPFDRSTDGGLNWTTINTGYVARGICDPGGSYIIIAGNNGVFVSSNNGSNFSNYGITSSATPVVKQEGPGITYTGLSGSSNGGVWVRNDPLGINQLSGIAKEFSLSQNYPNPFNPETSIKYQIPKAGFVQVKIFDVLGREVQALVNENLAIGSYEVQWNASAYPSGIYYYRLMAGEFSGTKKMVLIK